jgi:hypothetical protein
MAAALAAGNIVEIDNLLTAYLPTNALRTITTFTATAAQTTFSVSYTQGLIDVFYNGSNLAQSEYTATNGTSIILATACQLNDIVVVYAYSYSVGAYSGIGGSGTTNYVAKFSSSSAITNSLIFDNGTNVGIGTTSPTDSIGYGRALDIQSATGAALYLRDSDAPTTQYGFIAYDGNDNGLKINNENSSGFIRFNTAGSERMRITSGGNVGIGTGSPASYTLLDVNGQTIFRGNPILTSGNAFKFNNYYNSGTVTDRAVATGYAGQIYFDTSAGYISFQNSSSSSSADTNVTNTERMRITSDGNVEMQGTNSSAKFRFWRNYSGNNPGLSFYNTSGTEVFAFNGNNGSLAISGALSKGSGSFRIDHPLESLSETHQLVHSFIEGPQADLIYRGKLTLVNGKAQANIDEVSTMTNGTFEALCREVQCFTTNESGWDLIKGKVIGNIIYIESQNENSTDEISWMVIGERKDKHMMDTDWTDENGKIIVEPLKPNDPIITEPIVATN